ncbi:MAG TPA: transglutaminase family protein [Stenomitos sp.]
MLTESQWQAVLKLGNQVDAVLQQQQVGLMMGGEPTYVAVDHLQQPEWQTAALGAQKYEIAATVLQQLSARLIPAGSLLQYGVGKLYPGEPYARWALSCYWRTDGIALWRNPMLQRHSPLPEHTLCALDAKRFIEMLAAQLGLPAAPILPAWDSDLAEPKGYVLPLLAIAKANHWRWASCPWHLQPTGQQDAEPLTLTPGDAPMGQRLPLHQLKTPSTTINTVTELDAPLADGLTLPQKAAIVLAPNTIQVALTVEVRRGSVAVFFPPMASAYSFVDLVRAVEDTAATLDCPVWIEGFGPPIHLGIEQFQVTPDPGVLEINIHPVAHWPALVQQTTILHAIATHHGLGTCRYGWDGRLLSTGGGAHITIGGKTPFESPLLKRPDLVASLIAYWHHHPSLTYAFAGQFVGPTSQAPRVDEAHPYRLHELDVALQTLALCSEPSPELIDQLLQPLLTDASGNTHRAALCIDKLYPLDNPRLQWGLLEFRAFEMPHHPHLRLLQLLVVRSLVAWFWQNPYRRSLIPWGSVLQDRFFLPHFLEADWITVIQELNTAGFGFEYHWFKPLFAQRFPVYGQVALTSQAGDILVLELRHALEQWPVLPSTDPTQTARPVDHSMERLQVTLKSTADTLKHYQLLCNGQVVPLSPTTNACSLVAGVRFRARPYRGLSHPALAPMPSLTFEVIDRNTGAHLGGCVYHVGAPDGSAYSTLPPNATEATRRQQERFVPLAPSTEPIKIPPPHIHPEFPLTLDLRWAAIQELKPDREP